MRVPYYLEDPKKDPNLENYPHSDAGLLTQGLRKYEAFVEENPARGKGAK